MRGDRVGRNSVKSQRVLLGLRSRGNEEVETHRRGGSRRYRHMPQTRVGRARRISAGNAARPGTADASRAAVIIGIHLSTGDRPAAIHGQDSDVSNPIAARIHAAKTEGISLVAGENVRGS